MKFIKRENKNAYSKKNLTSCKVYKLIKYVITRINQNIMKVTDLEQQAGFIKTNSMILKQMAYKFQSYHQIKTLHCE